MSNQTLETLLQHRTIRKYSDKEIPKEIVDSIIEAGFRASTTGNMQVYSVVITQDAENKKKLWELHFKQNMVLEAPMVMTFCADFHRFNIWCKQRNAEPGYDNFLSFMTASIDAILVSQNVAVAAESYGLGIVYLGTTTYNADEIIELLKLPQHVMPITTLVIGYPAETPPLTDRLPDSGMVHYETYEDYTPQCIDEIYAEKEASQLTHDLIVENQLENLAQIFAYKRYTKKDNEYFSEKLLKTLAKQGFMKSL